MQAFRKLQASPRARGKSSPVLLKESKSSPLHRIIWTRLLARGQSSSRIKEECLLQHCTLYSEEDGLKEQETQCVIFILILLP